MFALIVATALQAAAPAAPAATAAPQQSAEQRTRAALASRGMSQAGIDMMIDTEKKHGPALREIAERGQAAQSNIQAALTKRPIDAEGFVAANTARGEAVAALQREAIAVANEQMRGLSPADRVVLAQLATSTPAKQAAPAAPAAKPKTKR
ncbi:MULTISPECIES: hypothetical protein [unclassified Sphingomonas]|uniref:hypothetical protein n=1 Tax=unclassified Sphingomonas TaxID=196159 RepID=UPI0009260FDA|nr:MULTISPECIES: hypothetical protein [unclassified Sphingomonas]OJU16732.1 MAG: hypothetical protein BGN95_11015 [Sphingomonas sp. 66-10]